MINDRELIYYEHVADPTKTRKLGFQKNIPFIINLPDFGHPYIRYSRHLTSLFSNENARKIILSGFSNLFYSRRFK